jgi:DNA-binding LacI/PurR family transcriptional regulator/signal transduction histidine kinase
VNHSRSRRMIGVMTAQLDDAYQYAVWRGISRRAKQLGTGLVCFAGRRLDAPTSGENAANVAFRLAGSRTVDGLIIITTTIATFLDAQEIERIFASRENLPQVSVGFAVRGVASVTVDGTQGVCDVVSHLIQEHGRKSFALIGGPAGHPEAEDRALAFRRVLEESGLTFDENLAVSGSFMKESGAQAAKALLALHRPFDALVCLNDQMALGALGILRESGIRVPSDVALVGFDGIEEAKFITPPLTTVEQPLEELGQYSVDMLFELMEGGVPKNRILTCRPVFRQSCGCAPTYGFDADLQEIPVHAPAGDREAISELIGFGERSDSDGFISRLNTALASTCQNGGAVGVWNDYLSVIRHRMGPSRLPTTTFELARVLVGDVESRLQAARRVQGEQRLAALRAVSSSLTGSFEMPLMLERLETGLSALGIDGGFLVLFDDGTPASGRGRLVMARHGEISDTLPLYGIPFATERLLPHRVGAGWKRGQWVLQPLVFQSESLGYLLLPGGAEEPAVYDTLRDELASALKGTLLLDQVRSHERRLEEEVARRTTELTRMNDELTEEIEGRRRLEREVLEISNRTMQRIGQDLHDDLCQHLAGIAMLAKVLRGGLSSSDSSAVSSIDQISELLADSISRARQIARGLHPAGLEEHGLTVAVEELVESARRMSTAAIEFRASPEFAIADSDSALQVYRIVQEALTNAMKHAESDRIEVRLFRADSLRPPSLVAEVTDNGIGLPNAPRGGMGLRIMRYRAETIGAELDIERLNPGTRVSCRIPGA